MKNSLLLLVLVLGLQTANAQYVNIPDANFRLYLKFLYPACFNVSDQMDTTCNAVLSETLMNTSSRSIISMEGMQYFKNLQSLDVFNNRITSLPRLPVTITSLSVQQNQMTSLPALPPNLKYLYAHYNNLTSLPAIPATVTRIYCGNNPITSLPILPDSLKELYCDYDSLTCLPTLPYKLNTLTCGNTRIVCLPNAINPGASISPALPLCNTGPCTYNPNFVSIPDTNFRRYLIQNVSSCMYGLLLDTACAATLVVNSFNVSGKNITSLQGVQYFKKLKTLDCSSNHLTSLGTLPRSLTSLSCGNNQLTSLPTTLPDSLAILNCSSNTISCLPNLYYGLMQLNTTGTSVICLPNPVQPSAVLTPFRPVCTSPCSYDTLRWVTIPDPNFRAYLKSLYPSCFNITDRMDTACSGIQNIYSLNISNKNIASLDKIKYLKSLNNMDCSRNQLTSFPVMPKNLQTLHCENNQLTSLSNLPALVQYLYCDSNQLTSLPTLYANMFTLTCTNNQLTSLPSPLPISLRTLYIDHNNISLLPVISNVWTFHCTYNPISCLPTLSSGLIALNVRHTSITCIPNSTNNATVDTILPICANPCSYQKYVTIPDDNFRAILKTQYPSCFNSLDMMDTTCALVNNEDSLMVSQRNISTLWGVQFFKNLKVLDANEANIIDASLPRLSSSLTYLSCRRNRYTSLPPLPSTLKYLYCSGNPLTSLPTLPAGLLELDCGYTYLSNLPALPLGMTSLTCNDDSLVSLPALPSSLTYLDCRSNKLYAGLPSLPNQLQTLYCAGNKLTSLPALPSTLLYLGCGSNKLSTLPQLPNKMRTLAMNYNLFITLPSPLPDSLTQLECDHDTLLTNLSGLPNHLQYLYCHNGKIASIDSLPKSLMRLIAYNNKLTTFPAFPPSLSYVECYNNNLTSLPAMPGVTYLSAYNNKLTSLPSVSSGMYFLDVSNNPLNCLPPLPYNITALGTNNTYITCFPNVIGATNVIPYRPVCTNTSNICTDNPLVQGKIYYDANNNGVYNTGESLIAQQIVKVSPNNWVASSSDSGKYLLKVDTAISNSWTLINNLRYATIAPASYSLNNLHGSGFVNGNFDFGVYLIPNVKDLESAVASSPARPGFSTTVSLSVNNVGTIDQNNVTVKLKKPNGFTVGTSTLAPSSVVNDTLIWNNISVNYLKSKFINVQMGVPVSAIIGSNAVFEVWANGMQGDTTPLDNYAKWTETIRSSFDPNDKLVNKSTLPPTYNANKDRLLYTIRFQNTGTFAAVNVLIRDILLPNLDVSSLRVVNASHVYKLTVRDKDVVDVLFSNIMLPDKTTNEAKSHGFVQLEFKPKVGLPVNTQIDNSAAIIFDYNTPVITNTATTKIQITTGIANNQKLAFKLFPNPASSIITVELPYEGKGKWYLTDISGKIIQQNNIENNTSSFDVNVNDIANGTYLLSLEISGVVSASKVVIMR